MNLAKRRIVLTLCLAVLGTTGIAATASAQGTDQCAGATYCLPAPPASATEKTDTDTAITDKAGKDVTFETQIGTALVYSINNSGGSGSGSSGSGSSGGGAPSGLFPIGILAIGCPDGCKLSAKISIKLANGKTLTLAPASTTVGPGGIITLKLRFTPLQLRQYQKAGGGTASLAISVTDKYGTHSDTVTAPSAPKKKAKSKG